MGGNLPHLVPIVADVGGNRAGVLITLQPIGGGAAGEIAEANGVALALCGDGSPTSTDAVVLCQGRGSGADGGDGCKGECFEVHGVRLFDVLSIGRSGCPVFNWWTVGRLSHHPVH